MWRLGRSSPGTENDVVRGSTGRLLHPADAKLLRVSLTYVLPGLAVFYVVLSGLWLLPDSFLGMYGNHDGHWASWSARSILEWGGFLDFSPVSPLTGTGSPFLPNLPWLNPGSLALAMPAPLPLRHLASMLVYLGGVVGVALFALSPPRVFARAFLPRDDLVYLHILYSAQRISPSPYPGTRSRHLTPI